VDPFVVIIGGLVLFFVLFVLALGMFHPRSGRQIVGKSLRSDEAEAEIEATDIDQMVDARDERRRRAGRPGIGDELEREVRRRPESS
jgi:hypothetical protein